MGFWEIFVIVLCTCTVVSTVVSCIVRRKKGKTCCEGNCSACSACSHCKSKR